MSPQTYAKLIDIKDEFRYEAQQMMGTPNAGKVQFWADKTPVCGPVGEPPAGQMASWPGQELAGLQFPNVLD